MLRDPWDANGTIHCCEENTEGWGRKAGICVPVFEFWEQISFTKSRSGTQYLGRLGLLHTALDWETLKLKSCDEDKP